jgi:hypothetical protein
MTAVQPIRNAEVAGSRGSIVLPVTCRIPNKHSMTTPATSIVLLIQEVNMLIPTSALI